MKNFEDLPAKYQDIDISRKFIISPDVELTLYLIPYKGFILELFEDDGSCNPIFTVVGIDEKVAFYWDDLCYAEGIKEISLSEEVISAGKELLKELKPYKKHIISFLVFRTALKIFFKK